MHVRDHCECDVCCPLRLSCAALPLCSDAPATIAISAIGGRDLVHTSECSASCARILADNTFADASHDCRRRHLTAASRLQKWPVSRYHCGMTIMLMSHEQALTIHHVTPCSPLLPQRKQHALQLQLVGVHAQRISCLCSTWSMAQLAERGCVTAGASKPDLVTTTPSHGGHSCASSSCHRRLCRLAQCALPRSETWGVPLGICDTTIRPRCHHKQIDDIPGNAPRESRGGEFERSCHILPWCLIAKVIQMGTVHC